VDVRTVQAGSRAVLGWHRRAGVSTIAGLAVLLLGVLTSLLAVPAADAAPVGPSQAAARHGRPGAPTLIGVYGNAHQVGIAYDAPKSDGGHKIRRYEATFNGGKTWKKIGREEDDYGELNGFRENLKVNKRYTVAVRAVNKKGHSKPSRMHTVIPVNGPSKPRDVTVKAVDHGVAVSWKPPRHDGGRPIVDYHVVAANDDAQLYGFCDPPGTARGCTITGLVSGTSYNLRMWASNYVEQPDDANPEIIGWTVSGFTTDLPFVTP
jgi:Fibronectin type III domain